MHSLSRAYANVGTIEEEAHHEDHGHAAGGRHQPEGQHAFGPAGTPCYGGTAVRQAIGDPAVRQVGFLAAHWRSSRSVEEVAGEQHTAGEHEQQAQIQAGAVELNR